MAADIIGRREELLALEAFLEAVPAGGQALLLEGEKTKTAVLSPN